MTADGRLEHLARVQLFSQCSKRQLRALAEESRVQQIEPGEHLVSAGSPSHDLFVILAGEVRIDRDGAEVDRVGPNGVVGEVGLLLDIPRNADVVAATPLEVLCLDRGSLQRILDRVPGLGWTLLTTVAERLHRLE